jgi:Tfp pilus assembly protein PilW
MRIHKNDRSSGVSLLELMITFVLFGIIAGSAIGGLVKYQKVFTSQNGLNDMHAGVRGAVELMTQEIGQAGTVPQIGGYGASGGGTTLAANVASGNARVASVATNVGMFVGENLLVDTGASQELVTVTALGNNSFTANFTMAHNAAVSVAAYGVFYRGVLPSSDWNNLKVVGDLNGDGNLEYVLYTCDFAKGELRRAFIPVPPAGVPVAPNLTGDVLMQGLTDNPAPYPAGRADGKYCFQYVTQTVPSNGDVYNTTVGLTMTTKVTLFDKNTNTYRDLLDPQTGQPITETKSFLNLSPRNVVAGYDLDAAGMNTGVMNRLQQPPAALLSSPY